MEYVVFVPIIIRSVAAVCNEVEEEYLGYGILSMGRETCFGCPWGHHWFVTSGFSYQFISMIYYSIDLVINILGT